MRPALLLAILIGAALLLLQLAPHLAAPPPLPPPTPPPLPQQVITQHPKVGVHTRLTDEAQPERITQTFALVREMGAAWAVEYFPWAYVQPDSRAHWDWAHADQVVNAAAQQG